MILALQVRKYVFRYEYKYFSWLLVFDWGLKYVTKEVHIINSRMDMNDFYQKVDDFRKLKIIGKLKLMKSSI